MTSVAPSPDSSTIGADELVAIPAEEISDAARLPPRPVVSVLMLTYNHAPFIGEAMASVVGQSCPFEYEVLVGDDASTDGTAAVCREWQARRPDRIRLITAPTNVGMHRNFLRLLARARAPYVAMCEGDDYWIDTAKLAKQVALMARHPEFALCGAQARNMQPRVWPSTGVCDWAEVLRRYPFHTSTVLFRRACLGAFPRAFLGVKALDSCLYVLLARQGTCGFLDTPVAFYRRHGGGVWSGMSLAARHVELCAFTDTLAGYFGPVARQPLLSRELGLTRELTSAALDDPSAARYGEVRRIARAGWRRLRVAFPVRATLWAAFVHAYPLAGLYRRARRRLASRSRWQRAMHRRGDA